MGPGCPMHKQRFLFVRRELRCARIVACEFFPSIDAYGIQNCCVLANLRGRESCAFLQVMLHPAVETMIRASVASCHLISKARDPFSSESRAVDLFLRFLAFSVRIISLMLECSEQNSMFVVPRQKRVFSILSNEEARVC